MPAEQLKPSNSAEHFKRPIDHLKIPALYHHPVDTFTLLETHISSVLLAGEFACKLKKPYNLSFLDFTTHQACNAKASAGELRRRHD